MAGQATGKGSKLYASTEGELKLADKLSNLVTIGELGFEAESIDVTNLDSSGKEYIPGDVDYGSLPVTGHLLNDGAYKKLEGFVGVQNVKWGVAHPTLKDANVQFTGHLESLKRGELNTTDVITFEASIKITGVPETFTEPVS